MKYILLMLCLFSQGGFANSRTQLLEVLKGQNSNSPVALLIHGIDYDQRELAEPLGILVNRGAQAYLFRWNNRDDFSETIQNLRLAILSIQGTFKQRQIFIFAHSAGGVLALRALDQIQSANLDTSAIHLFTAAAPVNGYGVPSGTPTGLMRTFIGDIKTEVGIGQSGKFTSLPLRNCRQYITTNCSLDQHACLTRGVHPQRAQHAPCGDTNQVFFDNESHISIFTRMIQSELK